MKITVNGQDLLEVQEWEKDILKGEILGDKLEEDLKRRLKWVIEHKIDRCFTRMFEHWMPIFREDPTYSTVPTDKKEFVALVLAHPQYKNRSQLDKEKEEND